MAVTDLWIGRDRKPTSRHGRGKRWRVTVPGHPSRAFNTKGEAQAWERHLWEAAPETAANTVTVAQLVDVWLAGKAGLSQGGLEQCQAAALRVHARWGSAAPEAVLRADVQAWIAGMTVTVKRRDPEAGETVPVEREASHTIRSKAIQCLGGALRIAHEMGLVTTLATDGVKIPRARKRRPRILTIAELARLAECCEMPDAIWLLGTSAARVSEAMRLTVGSVDRKRRRVTIEEAKNGETRDVVIPQSVLDRLDLGRPADAPLLVHPRGRNTDRRSFRQHVLLPAAERAGIVGLTTHHLRHTAVSQAIRAGADIKVVQEMAGHKSATMTWDTYGHLWEDSLALVAERMEAAIKAELADLERTENVPGGL